MQTLIAMSHHVSEETVLGRPCDSEVLLQHDLFWGFTAPSRTVIPYGDLLPISMFRG